MAKRMLIVEESLRDLNAHWFEYIRTISLEAEKLGWNVQVASHRDVAPEIKDSFSIFPVFKYARYLDSGKNKLPGERHFGFILHSLRSLRVLWPLLRENFLFDRVFVPTVMVHHLLAWYFIMMFHPNKPKHTTLFFVTNPGVWDTVNKKSFLPKSTIILKILLRLFSSLVHSGKVTLAVETRGAKVEFETLSGLPIKLLPHPVPVHKGSGSNKNPLSSGQTVYFGCYGFARYEKGSDLLKAAIEEILTQQPDFNGHFTIQWIDAFKMPDGSICEPSTFLKNHPKIRIIDRAVLSEEYIQMLAKMDCMILPYRNSSYYARVSRIAIESVTNGLPIIYTKDSWLEEMISEYGAGVAIRDESVENLVQAIFQIQENYSNYQVKASNRIDEAKEYYSPENFCKLLLNV